MPRIHYLDHPLPTGHTARVKFVYNSRLAKLIIPHMSAITLWNTVLCRHDALDERLIRHELRHVEQWHALGPVRFLTEYLWQSLRHGYYNNAFERDARHAEGESDSRFR